MFRGQACERPLGPCFLSLFIRACDARQRLSDVLQERDETRLFRRSTPQTLTLCMVCLRVQPHYQTALPRTHILQHTGAQTELSAQVHAGGDATAAQICHHITQRYNAPETP